MNTVLFPLAGSNPPLAITANDGTIGWVPVTKALDFLADNIPHKSKKNAEVKPLEDHAIPSPIAYFKDFYKKFVAGEAAEVNAWRGMLAAIALQSVKSLDISIIEIPLFDVGRGNPTPLAEVMLDELCANSSITGYQFDSKGVPNYESLYCFCKKDQIGNTQPFAMFIPTIGICPFKEYPVDLFAGLDWVNNETFAWEDIIEKGNLRDGIELNRTGQKLWVWLDQFAAAPGPATHYFDLFKNDLKGAGHEPDQNDPALALQNANYSLTPGKVWGSLKKICQLHKNAPKNAFADKMLILIPSANAEKIPKPNSTQQSNQQFTHFSPLIRYDNLSDAGYYVIPPIHTDVALKLQIEGTELLWWSVDYKADKQLFEVSFELAFSGGERGHYSRNYKFSEIAYIDTMPYLSLWPFVGFKDDSWKEHYVSAFYRGLQFGQNESRYTQITGRSDITHIVGVKRAGHAKILLDVITKNPHQTYNGANVRRYQCTSPFKEEGDDDRSDVEFEMISCASEPYAISFRYENQGAAYSLGCWVINRDGQTEAAAPMIGGSYAVAMDFGTTSTNVYLKADTDIARSILSPGTYVKDLYNPYTREDRDFYQNYYMFSPEEGELGKIFTYGQNFDAREGQAVIGGVSNASGRSVKVDEGYIMSALRVPETENGQAAVRTPGNGRIWNGLKWPKVDDNGMVVQEKPEIEEARKNFVSNILTYAILDAKVLGANAVNLNVSYPDAHFGSTVRRAINRHDLYEKSGVNIIPTYQTEAVCAGLYFSGLANNAPSPQVGYAILDIGGGSTDYSLWQQSTIEPKDQHSYGFAGASLIEKTIIRAKQSQPDFERMWLIANGGCQGAHSVKIYLDNLKLLEKPIGDITAEVPNNTVYRRCASALAYILDKVQFNKQALTRPEYARLLQAIRMKYYALFYLLAKHIRTQIDEGRFAVSPLGFNICLAGCGAKGIEWCEVNSPDFEEKVRKLFSVEFGAVSSHFTLKLTRPVKGNKEEVVIGLTKRVATAPAVPMTPAAPAMPGGGTWGNSAWGQIPGETVQNPVADPVVEEPMDEEDDAPREIIDPADFSYETLYGEYMNLLSCLFELEEARNNSDHLIHSIIPAISEDALNHFNSLFITVNSKKNMSSMNPTRKTYGATFALSMLDYMIDEAF